MRNFNKGQRGLEELLSSLHLMADGSNGPVSSARENSLSSAEAEDAPMAHLKAKAAHGVAVESVPFSLPSRERLWEETRCLSQKLVGSETGSSSTERDLRRCMSARKEKGRRVCPNWDEIAGVSSNAPRRISYRAVLKRRRGC
jgi:hypothetical protein